MEIPMIGRFKFSLLVVVAHVVVMEIGIAQDSTVRLAREQYREAVRDYGKRDFRGALNHLDSAVKLMPNHPRYVYGLAGLYALTGEKSRAMRYLDQIAQWGLDYRAETDSDFVSLFDDPEFRQTLKRFSFNRSLMGSAEPVCELPGGFVLAEGIAFDAREKVVFVGSVSSRTIIRVSENNTITDFSHPEDGLLGVFGMRVDPRRRVLWVCSSDVPQMKNRTDSEQGLSMVVKYDLNTGRPVKKYLPPDSGRGHLFGDLTVHPNGDVYVSDSRTSAIFRITSTQDELEVLLPGGFFSSLQGIDLTMDGTRLYVADYASGIFSVDLKTLVCRNVEIKTTTSLGIDGLYVQGNSLIAIQNGIRPHRILRIMLTDVSAPNVEILEANNPLFDEPTLGVIAGDSFFFVANSQWGSINEKGESVPGKALKPHILMKRKL